MSVPILTPPGPLSIRGKTLVDLVANQNVTWATDGGTLSGITTTMVTWKAPNKTGTWHVYATNGGSETGILTVVVESVLPNYWEFQNPIERTKKYLEFEPIAGQTQHRTFDGLNSQHKWELGADDSDQPEYLEIVDFWEWHHPGKTFLMTDPVINEPRRYESDSNLTGLYKQGDGYSWKFRIKEIWPYSIIV